MEITLLRKVYMLTKGKTRKAIKRHSCCLCRNQISYGEKYLDRSWRYKSHRACLEKAKRNLSKWVL